MKTEKELIELRTLYSTRMKDAEKNIEKFKGTAGEQEWLIQYYMARAKVLLLDYLLKEGE